MSHVVISYLEGPAKGSRDLIDLRDIDRARPSGTITHATLSNDWRGVSRCDVRWEGHDAILAYGGKHAAYNEAQEIFIGDLKFNPDLLLQQKSVLWRDEKSPDFEPVSAKVRSVSRREGDRRKGSSTRLSRNSQLAALKIAEAAAKGEMRCSACRSTGHAAYGDKHSACLEVHHDEALKLGPRDTVLDGLVLLCANCHRVLHSFGDEPIRKFLRRFAEA